LQNAWHLLSGQEKAFDDFSQPEMSASVMEGVGRKAPLELAAFIQEFSFIFNALIL
jgi:hypothetical protein